MIFLLTTFGIVVQVQFAASSGKPWMLLVPNFIYTKDFFKLNGERHRYYSRSLAS